VVAALRVAVFKGLGAVPPQERATYLVMAVVLVLAFTAAFSEFCRHWYLLYGGFSASATDYGHWLRYGLSWLLDNATFNLSQAFSWPVTEIRPTAFWPRLLAFLFSLFFDYIVVRSVMALLRPTTAADT
jgi:hypothetical protein